MNHRAEEETEIPSAAHFYVILDSLSMEYNRSQQCQIWPIAGLDLGSGFSMAVSGV